MACLGRSSLNPFNKDRERGKGRPLRQGLLLAFLVLLVLVPSGRLAEAAPFPAPRGAVNDFANLIAPPEAAQIEALAREVLAKTGTSLVVVTMETIGDQDPNDYANRLYQAWGIGRKGEDKGVLVFLALKERRVRIETGYGVEGILPDGLAGEILDRYALPAFRKGQYGRGFAETTAAIAAVIAKAAGVSLTGAAPPAPRPAPPQRGFTLLQTVLLGVVLFFLFGTRPGRAMLPWLLFLLMSGGSGRRGGGFGGFGGGGFGGFGGGSSGGGGASRGF